MIKFISRLALTGSRIDRENGVIKDVSLIALGDARGHGKSVDQKTLETVVACAKQYPEGLRIKFNPNTFAHGVGSLAGYMPSNTIRVKGDKAVGDLHLYSNMPSEAKEYLCEIVERTPGNIGLSIEFSGEDETIDDNKFARCDEILSAVVVDLPAANPTGFFAVGEQSKPDNIKETPMDEETIKKLSTAMATAVTTAVLAGLKPVIQKFEAAANGKSGEETEKEEMAAAGVTDGDDDATKREKIEKYRSSQSKPVTAMSVGELGRFITDSTTKAHMQLFRQTGNRAAIANAEPDRTKGGDVDPFEARIQKHMDAGAKSRGLAINRARRDSGKEYNAWMAKKHPNVQQMAG